MIELGKAATGAADGPIKDATDATFMADVIEASRETPVIVDFWAPWCGPCKQLTPALEDAVMAAKGAVKLVKVNVDENQMVAAQLRVQSIPAVFAFADGQPVDGFMGALPPSQIKEFVQKLSAGAGGHSMDDVLDACDQILEEGHTAEAMQGYAGVLTEEPANARAHAGMVRVHLVAGDFEKARLTLSQVPAEIAEDAHIVAARSALDLAEASAGAGEAAEFHARLQANPDDHQARLDLALALLAQNDAEGAIEALLELFRRDREWNEGAAKAQLMKLFDSLGPTDPAVQKGRRRLSSMIFA